MRSTKRFISATNGRGDTVKTWIKLYTEILSDPKMGRMNDKLFRRTIELFLLAGKEDNDGELPKTDDIAWSLHISEKEVKNILKELVKVGIVTFGSDIDGSEKYLISNFASRQNSAFDRSEINRRYYEKSKSKKSEIQTSESLTVRPNSDIQTSESNTVEVEVEEEVDKEVEVEVDKDIVRKRTKPTKHKHGNYQHVLLTDDEYQKLQERFPNDYQKRIQNLDDYLQQHADKHYSDHYLTIIKWSQKDDSQKAKIAPVQQKKSYTFQEVGEMMRNGELTL